MVRDRGDGAFPAAHLGVPIPIFYCDDCGEHVISDETIDRVSKLFAEHGSDIWFIKDAAELLPEGYQCTACGGAISVKRPTSWTCGLTPLQPHGVLRT